MSKNQEKDINGFSFFFTKDSLILDTARKCTNHISNNVHIRYAADDVSSLNFSMVRPAANLNEHDEPLCAQQLLYLAWTRNNII